MSLLLATRPVCVCVPARDEAERLPKLLAALAAQDWSKPLSVVVALNNTSDGSRAIVERFAHENQGALTLHLDEQTFPPELAHAGSARRRAMDLGLEIVGEDERAILLTTDADARPPQDWVRRNVEAIERGVDLVGGALALDDDEPVSPLARSRWQAFAAYWRAVREIEDEIDPVAWDPPSRHGDHTGGSLATTVAAYRATGGVPVIPLGEDAAYVAVARARGFRLAHPVSVWTCVSPRIVARAAGGMGAKLEALSKGDPAAMAAPSLHRWRERAIWRRSVRLVGGDPAVAVQEAELPPMPCDILVTAAAPDAAA